MIIILWVFSFRKKKKRQNPKYNKWLNSNKKLFKELKINKLQHKHLIVFLSKKLSNNMK